MLKEKLDKRDHVSFSAMQIWLTCPYKYKLKYIENVPFVPSPYLDYGSTLHNVINKWVENHGLDLTIRDIQDDFEIKLRKLISENKEKYNEEHRCIDENLWVLQGRETLNNLEKFMQDEFSDYSLFRAEYPLKENMAGNDDITFNGFIDIILKHKTEENKYYILDWKTTTWGWGAAQKADKIKKMQLLLYKYFYCQKNNIPDKNIDVAFVLLKRTAKKNKQFERINIRSSEKYVVRAIEHLYKFINGLNNNIYVKNLLACEKCEFKGTKYCEKLLRFYPMTERGNSIVEELEKRGRIPIIPKKKPIWENNCNHNVVDKKTKMLYNIEKIVGKQ